MGVYTYSLSTFPAKQKSLIRVEITEQKPGAGPFIHETPKCGFNNKYDWYMKGSKGFSGVKSLIFQDIKQQ